MRGIHGERGQAMMESGIALLILTVLTAGVIDSSRGFYQYNVVVAAAHYGARWGSVVGGMCSTPNGADSSDWCNQDRQALNLNLTSIPFWQQTGNIPLQASGVSCPTSFDPNFTGYYTASSYVTGTATTIVGAVAQRFDTTSQSYGFIQGLVVPGLDLSKLKICIQLTWNSTLSRWSTQAGDKVAVFVYYPYTPATAVSTLVKQINLVASSEYRID